MELYYPWISGPLRVSQKQFENNNFMRVMILKGWYTQKNPRVRKTLVRNSGAGNGCANFVGA